ncbi:MAG: hypothetical protein GXO74_09750 [Calditrichaeota bacterium]|nr:hypothetical protein [Calditrichota bacterium]
MKRSNIFIFASLLGLMVLFLLSCEKKEEVLIPKPTKPTEETNVAPAVDSAMAKQLALKEQLEITLKDLEAKRAALVKKQQELDEEIKALGEKQSEVLSVQSQLKTFQIVSIVLFALGLLAVVVGIVMILRTKKKGSAEVISETEKKTGRTPEKKTKEKVGKIKEEKPAEKPKARKSQTRLKKTPPAQKGENKKEG